MFEYQRLKYDSIINTLESRPMFHSWSAYISTNSPYGITVNTTSHRRTKRSILKQYKLPLCTLELEQHWNSWTTRDFRELKIFLKIKGRVYNAAPEDEGRAAPNAVGWLLAWRTRVVRVQSHQVPPRGTTQRQLIDAVSDVTWDNIQHSYPFIHYYYVRPAFTTARNSNST